jgi:hypothetical protein
VVRVAQAQARPAQKLVQAARSRRPVRVQVAPVQVVLRASLQRVPAEPSLQLVAAARVVAVAEAMRVAVAVAQVAVARLVPLAATRPTWIVR